MTEVKTSFIGTAIEFSVECEELVQMVRNEVVRRRSLPHWDEQYMSREVGMRIAQWSQNTLKDAVNRVAAGESAFAAKAGRPPKRQEA